MYISTYSILNPTNTKCGANFTKFVPLLYISHF